MNNNISFICSDFQQKIVEVFNSQNDLPFILKYFLFKQIWEKIQQKKIEDNYRVQAMRAQHKETITTEVSLPEDFLQNSDNNKE